MKVRIYQPHTHAGVRHVPGPEGVEIDVSEQDRKFLDRAGITTAPHAVPALRDVQPETVVIDPPASNPSVTDPKPAKR